MAISLTCECGKKLAVKEELAGKKVRCPSCESLLTVPSLSGEKPARKRPAAVDDDEDQEDQDEVRPRKKKKKKRAAKSNKMMWIGAGAGVLVLGMCCLGGAGTGLWYFLGSKSTEKTIIGKWQVDVAKMKANPPNNRPFTKKDEDDMTKTSLEFKTDNALVLSLDKISITGKYKILTTVNDTLRLNWTMEFAGVPQTQLFEVTVVDKDHLKMTPVQRPPAVGGMFSGPETLYLKRVP
jgi:hypothetical protein